MGSESLGQAREGEPVKPIVDRQYSSPDVLELREIDGPAVTDDSVLVRVRASSMNPLD